MNLRRLAGGIAMLACCGTIAACGSSDDPESTGTSETPASQTQLSGK